MYLRTLTVLMWRHWLVRRSKYFSSMIEFFAPVLPFVLIYVFREKLFPEISHSDALIGVEKPEAIPLRNMNGPPCVLYTPDTSFTRTLMGLVGKKLKLRPLKKLDTNSHGYFLFTNASTIFRYTESMGPDEAVVIFHNVLGLSLPDSLNYSIRMKTPINMQLATKGENSEYHSVSMAEEENNAVNEPFIKLQWAIDTSFIQLLSGRKVMQKMTLQEFPHAENTESATSSMKSGVLILAANIGIMPVFFTFMLRMIIEKASGIQELMKMAGVTTHTLVTSHILNVLLPGLIYSVGATVMMKLEPSAVLPKSNSLLMFLAFLLQFIVTIFVALVGSFVARLVSPTALTVLTLYIFLTLPAFVLNDMNLTNCFYVCGLTPFLPLIWILKEACELEEDSGLTFATIMKSHSVTSFPILVVYLYFILQIILCLVLFWYFEKVIPGLYGSKHPWYFPFQKSYWSKTAEKPGLTAEISSTQIQNPEYFEALPEPFEVGIEVIHVTKMYSKLRALDNVSLEVYKGEITALIGHNGAGKSTLISVVTGMTNATKGKVLVNGLDISSEKTLARQHIGLCPQQNIFLDNVSVIEHVMFFTLLNKGTFKTARKWSKELLVELNLEEKAYKYTPALSGGMKRRAQLACALASQASVLLLDEPTSGLDVETRRSLWDLVLSLRGSHTVLLSTHFMEEADALADRVVALHTGHLYCHATPMFLKRALGTGYRLTFTTIEEPDEPAITSVVESVVPKATVKEIGFNSISYILPSSNTKKFPKLFSKLESRKSKLGVDSIGVGTTTLEEVFLKLFSAVINTSLDDDELKEEHQLKKLQPGALLYVRQTKVLIKRYLRFIWIYKMTQIVFGIIPMVIFILVITHVTNDFKQPRTDRTIETMNLDLYGPSLDHNILYKVDGTASDLRPLSDQYPRVNFENSSDIGEAVLRTRKQDKKEKYLAGIELNDTDAKVLYTTKVRHTAPVALNLLSNLMATRTIPGATGRTITVQAHPLPGAFIPHSAMDLTLPKSDTMYWCFYITLMLLSGFTFMIQLPCLEASGARHIHLLAGCTPELHWVAMLLAVTLQVLVVYVTILVIACAYLDYDSTLSDSGFIFAISVVVLLGSMAVLAFSFQLTFHFRQSVAVGILLGVIVLSMFIFPIGFMLVPAAAKFQLPLLIVLPPYTFAEAMIGCSSTAYLNALCKLNRDKCPIVAFPFLHFDSVRCCESQSNPWCYFSFEKPAPGMKIIYLIAQILIYMIFVCVTQRGTCSMVEEKIKNSFYKDPGKRCNEDSVNAEQAYVEEVIVQKKKDEDCNVCDAKISDVMLVSNVHKKYQDCSSGVSAVKGVSFSVKKGECFGLLGVNGAGKSTMFQMLTAIQCPTKGRIFANEHEMTFPYSTKYLHSLGYCPQFWGLDDFLTGRQTLSLLLTLNGLSSHDTNTETMFWIRLVGLEQHADKLVSSYSGGCLRRMAAASALCTGASIVLLDEPTAGVDVAARRCVWAAFKRALDERRAIIITSHSLDEMEALCDRVAIMVAGEICALGSPAALRADYATGHSVVMKIKYESLKHHRTSGNRDSLDLLKATIEKKFECTLKDDRKTMLHYRINKTMKYSKIFRVMEKLQASFSDLIEDYSVSETTLEEVFLTFTNK